MSVIQQQVTELHEAGVRYAASDPQVNEVADVYWVADHPNVVLADGNDRAGKIHGRGNASWMAHYSSGRSTCPSGLPTMRRSSSS